MFIRKIRAMQRLWEQITSGIVPGVETGNSSANAAG